MSRKHTVPQTDSLNNGQADRGDAREPADDAGTRSNAAASLPATDPFEPGDLEADVSPAPSTPTSPDSGPDPFDPASLRLSQDLDASMGVQEILLTVPVRKPSKSGFFRVHPSPHYTLPTILLELEEGRGETYLVAPGLRAALAAEPACAPWQLYTAMDRQGVLFLWKVRLPGPDGKSNPWWDSTHKAAALAREKWTKVAAVQALGAYKTWQALGDLAEPEWPDIPFRELLRIAFRDRLIDTLNHPILRRLRGEV
jgi:hypothetical protein